MENLDDWSAADAAEPDAHVHAHEAFSHHLNCAVRVQLCLRFSDLARKECEAAEGALALALKRAVAAREYLERTTTTLESAVRLHALGRR